MAITRSPKRREAQPGSTSGEPDEAKIQDVIRRGGSVARDQQEDNYEDELKNVQLRLYQSMIAEIDERRSKIKRGKRPSRHAWIVAAIEEKLAQKH